MKFKLFLFLILTFSLSLAKGISQPYSLSKEIKPIKLELIEDSRPERKGEKGIVYTGAIIDSAQYHYVRGYDMYQLVDVLVTNIENDAPLIVELVKDNWQDIIEKQRTDKAKDGLVNFKLRDYGSFGIKVESPEGKSAKYTIAVIASPPKQNHLKSPFVAIDKKEVNQVEGAAGQTANTETATVVESQGSSILYILLGLALLVIGILVGKLAGRSKSTSVFILFFFLSFAANGQDSEGLSSVQAYEEEASGAQDNAYRSSSDQILSRLEEIRNNWNSIEEFRSEYNGLSNCMPSGGAPSEPRIPSFCTDEGDTGAIGTGGDLSTQSCTDCFSSARSAFNQTRYKLEQLAIIYKCTKRYSEAAIALGDNASGVHAVTGLVWQKERFKILKTVENLEKEYDLTYDYLIQDLRNNMMELNICEERFGVEDWFNRFGYVYYEFVQEKYRRSN